MSEVKSQRVQELTSARTGRQLAEFKRLIETEGVAIAVSVFVTSAAEIVGAALATLKEPESRGVAQIAFAAAVMNCTELYGLNLEVSKAIETAQAKK